MYIPAWLVVLAAVLSVGHFVWTFLLATGRNPLPFPDRGSRIFSAASAQAKDAVVALLAEHGIRERFQFNTGGVQRSIMWDGTIINHSSPEVLQKLVGATSSIGLVTSDPAASAQRAARFLKARGFEARVVLDAEPDLPIAFVLSDAMPGTVINFRKHVIHLPRPQSAPRQTS
ncbi:hypothetical protein [Dokdonella sp.]|uniref:hypothetical protein n=1 Tax=Dokdonella sp. TaxID=2291710 RepID=UPI003C5C0060